MTGGRATRWLVLAVATLALFLGAASLAMVPVVCAVHRAHAEQNAENIRRAVLGRGVIEPSACPTVRGLIDANLLDEATAVDDPWGSPFVIVCDPTGSIEVRSAGTDRVPRTLDDIIAPRLQ